MFGRGGMKKVFESPPIISAQSNNIMLDSLGHLGNHNSIRVTYIDFDTDTQIDEIIDADVYEKRRRDDVLRRRVRPRLDDGRPTPNDAPSSSNDVPMPESSQRSETISQPGIPRHYAPIPRPNVPGNPATNTSPPLTPNPAPKKFRLASELSETVTVAQVGEQLMDTPVQLSMRQVMAVAPDLAGYMHDQTRKRRIPVDATASSALAGIPPDLPRLLPETSASINSAQINRTFYACPSGHAKATIDQQVKVKALMDNGSEVNMMPRRVFETLDLPIDTDIRWRINTYNSDTDLEDHGPVGVCHSVPIDVGGVEINQPVFVVEHANQDLLLGRPWERAVRAEYINEDDGSLTARIKSPDGRRVVQFCACKAEHERNREYARHADDQSIGYDPLKA